MNNNERPILKNLLIYGSIFDACDDLTNEEAGQLFKALNSFRKGEDVDFEDRYLKGLWKGILPNLEKLEESYINKVQQNRDNGKYGKLGGRPKKETPSSHVTTSQIGQPIEEPKLDVVSDDKPKLDHQPIQEEIVQHKSNKTLVMADDDELMPWEKEDFVFEETKISDKDELPHNIKSKEILTAYSRQLIDENPSFITKKITIETMIGNWLLKSKASVLKEYHK